MTTVERDGRSIHYEVLGRGEAPALLLVMGLALSSRAWDTLPARLAKRYRVIVFDNRGTGRSARGGVAFRMRDLADDAAAVLCAAGVTEVHEHDGAREGGAYVFGISMGGMIAQHLALRHPRLVRKLVLGATFASWLRARKPRLSIQRDLARSMLRGKRVSGELLGRYLVSAEWHAAHPRGALEWMQRAERTTLRYAAAQVAAIVRHHAEEPLRTLRVPTLVMSGDVDALVPVENSLRLRELIPGAELKLLRGAGHAFPLEREEEVVEEIERFFPAP